MQNKITIIISCYSVILDEKNIMYEIYHFYDILEYMTQKTNYLTCNICNFYLQITNVYTYLGLAIKLNR